MKHIVQWDGWERKWHAFFGLTIRITLAFLYPRVSDTVFELTLLGSTATHVVNEMQLSTDYKFAARFVIQ